MLIFVSYGTLIFGDVVLAFLSKASPKNGLLGLKGMYSKDPEMGYKLTPGWSGYWDDGILRSRYEINSLGHRDREPALLPPSSKRVLLLGDSFTFGNLVTQGETIDSYVEKLSKGRVDAYNLGLAGAGPPHLLAMLEGLSETIQADALVYLFYANDLRDDNLRIDNHLIVDGHLISRYDREKGVWRSEEEIVSGMRQVVKQPRRSTVVDKALGVLTLEHLRDRVGALRNSNKPQDLFPGRKGLNYRDSNISQVIEFVRKVSAEAVRRGMDFNVLIIPGVAETRAKKYSDPTARFVAALKKEYPEVIELIDVLSTADYIPHDGHFNSKGSRIAAREILSRLYKDELFNLEEEDILDAK
jgi:hypothetical protein